MLDRPVVAVRAGMYYIIYVSLMLFEGGSLSCSRIARTVDFRDMLAAGRQVDSLFELLAGVFVLDPREDAHIASVYGSRLYECEWFVLDGCQASGFCVRRRTHGSTVLR